MLPPQSIRHLLICAGGIIAFVFLAIYPSQKSLSRLDKEIKKTESQIEDQKILFPIAKEMLSKVMEKETRALPFPDIKKLERGKISEIPVILEEMAARHGLDVISIIPEVRSLSEKEGFLSVNADVKGTFHNLREWLVDMGALQYLERIEEIKIQPAEGAKECILKIWIAIEG